MITIFTPIYNRAYIIKNLYDSLLRQSCYDFEWLIVDDGSTDNVASLVNQWIENTWQFKIRFYQQQNRGKHGAVNNGVKLAEYGAFFIVDSDDYLEDNAVETIIQYWSEISEDGRFAGISGLRRNKCGKVVGGMPVFEEYVDALNTERGKYGLNGDKAEVYKTALLRKYPFPEYEGEKFLTEAVVWDRLAYEGYQIRWLNRSFVVCDYLADGLTAGGDQLFIVNPKGWAHYIRTDAVYRAAGTDEYLRKCYYYYECEHTRFTDDEIKELLDLKTEEIDNMKTQYREFTEKINRICAGKRLAVYGNGQWGKRFRKCLEQLQVKVSYVIDKKYEGICGVAAYSIEMKLPEADVVFIALSTGAENVAKDVRKRMPRAKIVLCKEIVPGLW